MKRNYMRNTLSRRNARGALGPGVLPLPSMLCKENCNLPDIKGERTKQTKKERKKGSTSMQRKVKRVEKRSE